MYIYLTPNRDYHTQLYDSLNLLTVNSAATNIPRAQFPNPYALLGASFVIFLPFCSKFSY